MGFKRHPKRSFSNAKSRSRFAFASFVVVCMLNSACEAASAQVAVRNKADVKLMNRLFDESSCICVSAPEGNPTVLEFLFTPYVLELELTDAQVKKFAEVSMALKEELSEHFPNQRIMQMGLSQLNALIQQLRYVDPSRLKDVNKIINDHRKESRDILLSHQLDQLKSEALRQLGLRALRYEEIDKAIGISEGQRIKLEKGVEKINKQFRDAAIPKLPTEEQRKLLRAAGAKSSKELVEPRTEAQLLEAIAKRDADISDLLKKVIQPKQFQELERLVRLAKEKHER